MKSTSTVDVAVDPMTAFGAFTGEIDQWWGNGPIDAWDSRAASAVASNPASAGACWSCTRTHSSSVGSRRWTFAQARPTMR